MKDLGTRVAELLAAFEREFFFGEGVEFELLPVEGPTLSPAEQDLLQALGDAIRVPLTPIVRVGKTEATPSGWHAYVPFDEMMRALAPSHFVVS